MVDIVNAIRDNPNYVLINHLEIRMDKTMNILISKFKYQNYLSTVRQANQKLKRRGRECIIFLHFNMSF